MLVYDPEKENKRSLRNVGKYLPIYTKQRSKYSFLLSHRFRGA
jgi:hypothetical protein